MIPDSRDRTQRPLVQISVQQAPYRGLISFGAQSPPGSFSSHPRFDKEWRLRGAGGVFRVTQLESGVQVVSSRCLSPWGAPCSLGSSGMVLRGELLVEGGQRKGEGSSVGEKPGRGSR